MAGSKSQAPLEEGSPLVTSEQNPRMLTMTTTTLCRFNMVGGSTNPWPSSRRPPPSAWAFDVRGSRDSDHCTGCLGSLSWDSVEQLVLSLKFPGFRGKSSPMTPSWKVPNDPQLDQAMVHHRCILRCLSTAHALHEASANNSQFATNSRVQMICTQQQLHVLEEHNSKNICGMFRKTMVIMLGWFQNGSNIGNMCNKIFGRLSMSVGPSRISLIKQFSMWCYVHNVLKTKKKQVGHSELKLVEMLWLCPTQQMRAENCRNLRSHGAGLGPKAIVWLLTGCEKEPGVPNIGCQDSFRNCQGFCHA